MRRGSVMICGILLVLVVSGMQGCADLYFRNYGRFSPDQGVTEALEHYQVDPKMNYYISGSDVHPNALLGLDKNYVLDTTLWKWVDMTPPRLKEIVSGMQQKTSTLMQNLFGFVLLDYQGKPVGIWYSILSATTTVHFKEDNHVLIYTPDLDTYDKFEIDHGGHGSGMK